MTSDFSMEIIKAGRAWMDVPHTLRGHRCQSRLSHPGKLSITLTKKLKTFYDKMKFKQFLSTNLTLQKALEGKLHSEEVNHTQEASNK